MVRCALCAGDDSYASGMRYVKERFLQLNRREGRERLYAHETCATDSDQVKVVIESVIETIMQKNCANTGLR